MMYREFSDTESSAIASLAVLFNGVNITYRSNTEKQYIYKGSDRFVAHIRALLTNWNSDEISIGSVIAKARKSGDLKNTELW